MLPLHVGFSSSSLWVMDHLLDMWRLMMNSLQDTGVRLRGDHGKAVVELPGQRKLQLHWRTMRTSACFIEGIKIFCPVFSWIAAQ